MCVSQTCTYTVTYYVKCLSETDIMAYIQTDKGQKTKIII